jgi:hypothetical protein
MARLLVQSLATGCFLCPSLDDGQPVWVASLREAGGGVVLDSEAAHQLVQDWCEPEDMPCLVDLDRLGTAADYLPEEGGDHDARARAAGAGGAVPALPSIPVGNHGDNDFFPPGALPTTPARGTV